LSRQVEFTAERAKLLSRVAVLAVLIATLWPFNPVPRNGAQWLPGGTGLRFGADGVVVSTSSFLPPEGDARSYTLELLLRPATGRQTILTIYSPHRSKFLVVRQHLSGLVVTHDVDVYNDPTRSVSVYVNQVFRPGATVQVTISSGPDGTGVYVNGQLADRIPPFAIVRDEVAGEIDLGCAPIGHSTWRGEFFGLALYAKALTPDQAMEHYQAWTEAGRPVDLEGALARYRFVEQSGDEIRNEVVSGPNLAIAKNFFVPHKAFLASPPSEFKPDWSYLHDVIINIVGFMPLGGIVCAYFLWKNPSSKALILTTISCGLLSLTIEILQYFVPRRGSGWTDVITNSLGAFLGALLLRLGIVRRVLASARLVPKG
jgi:VanZ family protein